MKAKTLTLSAIICGASILGMSFAPVYAASINTNTKIESNIETEQLSQKVRDRNAAIGAVLGIAAIAAIANHNEKHKDDHHYDKHRGNHGNRRTPPPPPPHHRR